jgi:hypothetical protein
MFELAYSALVAAKLHHSALRSVAWKVVEHPDLALKKC